MNVEHRMSNEFSIQKHSIEQQNKCLMRDCHDCMHVFKNKYLCDFCAHTISRRQFIFRIIHMRMFDNLILLPI